MDIFEWLPDGANLSPFEDAKGAVTAFIAVLLGVGLLLSLIFAAINFVKMTANTRGGNLNKAKDDKSALMMNMAYVGGILLFGVIVGVIKGIFELVT